MKTFILFFVALLAGAMSVNAQNLIAVQKGGAPTFYTDLPTAISKTVAGDTVYIPGGGYGDITISKKLCLIGVGANPDSTHATARTVISSITFGTGADYGSLTGLYISSISTNGSFKNYTISRCYLGYVYLAGYTGFANFTFSENIIGNLMIDGTNHNLSNNIFFGVGVGAGTDNLNGSLVKNNIFLNYSYTSGSNAIPPLYASNCEVANNVFVQIYGYNGPTSSCYGSNNVLNNNVNAGINGTDGSNQGSGNFLSTTAVSLQNIFTTYDPTKISGDGVYEQNFTLPANSPYKNAGTDGTDIGIYGGASPWKPGSIPFNPHFQSLNVAPKTDSSGNLKVQITVAAQNN